jgi:hypothetical protein
VDENQVKGTNKSSIVLYLGVVGPVLWGGMLWEGVFWGGVFWDELVEGEGVETGVRAVDIATPGGILGGVLVCVTVGLLG